MAIRLRPEQIVRMAGKSDQRPKRKRISLGSGLRRRGTELGLAQAEVARRVGISPERYGQYVRDEREPDFDTLDEICRVLKTTPDKLLGYLPESEPKPTHSYAAKVREIAARIDGIDEGTLDVVLRIVSVALPQAVHPAAPEPQPKQAEKPKKTRTGRTAPVIPRGTDGDSLI